MGLFIILEAVCIVVIVGRNCPENVWTVIGAIATFGGALATAAAAIIALTTAGKANETNKEMLEVQQKQFEFSVSPNIQCYFRAYKTESGIPFMVLETKNYGGLTARDITLSVIFPEEISSFF